MACGRLRGKSEPDLEFWRGASFSVKVICVWKDKLVYGFCLCTDKIKPDISFSGSKFTKWNHYFFLFCFCQFWFPNFKTNNKKKTFPSSAKYTDREVVAQVFGSEGAKTRQNGRTKRKKYPNQTKNPPTPLAMQRISDRNVAFSRCSLNGTLRICCIKTLSFPVATRGGILRREINAKPPENC